MSFFDTRSVAGGVDDDGLWQAPCRAFAPGPASTPEALPVEPAPENRRAPRGDEVWHERLDSALSSGMSADTARRTNEDALRARREAAFEAWLLQCAVEIRPVLERSAQMLREWGLEARVIETVDDRPLRMPRRFDLALRIGRFGDRGPGKLTISATETSEVVRVTIKLGPRCIGADGNEHVGLTTTHELSGDLVGGLVATLVEQLFSHEDQ